MTMHFMNDDEAAFFREIREWWRGKQMEGPQSPEEGRPQTPDVFVAKPRDASGIPAITVDAGGTDPDQPGRGLCDVARITYAAGDMEIHLLSGFREVYNYRPHVVPKEWVVVVRTKTGRWVALPRDEVTAFTLTEDMGETDAGEASCTIQDVWNPATESYSGTDVGIVKDTVDIFTDATSGSKGIGHWRRGDDRLIIEPYNIECP